MRKGKYRHFKGKYYLVHGEVVNSETKEDMVIYTALYYPYETYVRPKNMFHEYVDTFSNEHEPIKVRRFTYVVDEEI